MTVYTGGTVQTGSRLNLETFIQNAGKNLGLEAVHRYADNADLSFRIVGTVNRETINPTKALKQLCSQILLVLLDFGNCFVLQGKVPNEGIL